MVTWIVHSIRARHEAFFRWKKTRSLTYVAHSVPFNYKTHLLCASVRARFFRCLAVSKISFCTFLSIIQCKWNKKSVPLVVAFLFTSSWTYKCVLDAQQVTYLSYEYGNFLLSSLCPTGFVNIVFFITFGKLISKFSFFYVYYPITPHLLMF